MAKGLPVEYRVGLVTFYLSNGFYEESLAMLQEDREVGEVLMRKALAHEAEMVHEPVKTPVKAR